VIGDLVFNDLDGDGIQDLGEYGVNGVTVELWSVGADGIVNTSDDAVVLTTTTIGGRYQFVGIDAGTYYIHVVRPAGFLISPEDQGTDDAKDSDVDPSGGFSAPFTVVEKQKLLTEDAGLFKPRITSSDVTL